MDISFKDFVLQNSTIKKSFIDDFYDIIKEDYFELSDQFLINSNDLMKWLNITCRQDFHKTIINSYEINKDYILTKPKLKGYGKSNEKIYMITPDCVRVILQLTRSKKGDEVRQYFIQIEKLLYKYKNLIIENMAKELELIKNNQKPKLKNTKNKIYVFKALNTELTLYKIGRATDLKKRLLSHNSPMANDLKVLYEYETDNIEQVESCLKTLMKSAQYRKYKEVYKIDVEIIKTLIQQCDNGIKLVQTYAKTQNGGELFIYIPN